MKVKAQQAQQKIVDEMDQVADLLSAMVINILSSIASNHPFYFLKMVDDYTRGKYETMWNNASNQ